MLVKERHGDQSQEENNTIRAANVAGNYCLVSNTGMKLIVDSGTTDHMCYYISMFKSGNTVHGVTNHITIPNGKKVTCTFRNSPD